MWRGLTPEMDQALRGKTVRPAIMFALDHSAGWVRLWSGLGNIQWSAVPSSVPADAAGTYKGAMGILSCTAEQQTTEVQVAQMTFQLKAADFDDQLMTLITQPVRRRPLWSWKALLDGNGNVIPYPRLRFKGYADQPRIVDEVRDEDGSILRHIEMSATGKFSNLTVPLRTQVSHEEQQKLFPGDDGLSLMAQIGEQSLVWDVGAYNNFSPP